MELDDIITDGKHITQLRTVLVKSMGENGADKLINNILELIQELPSAEEGSQNRHGLLLGYIQSGKTFAFTTAIALAADNGYRLFIILTSNNLILYNQTIDERLKQDLQSIEVEGKDSWEQKILMMTQTLKDPKGVLVLVTTKNTAILYKLEQTLRTIQEELKMGLPIALIIDDEADEGGLDTNTRRRSVNPLIEAGPTFSAIEEIRRLVPNHVRLQVTATPQALFLQDSGHESRPGFTVLLEPGADYVGSEQFFALKQEIDMIYENDDENELEERKSKIIRRIDQHDIHMMIEQEGDSIPDSLRDALLTFYIGATIKIVDEPSTRFSFLCHISARKADHDKISQIINKYIGVLRKSLIDYVDNNITSEDIYYLEKIYTDIISTYEDGISLGTIINELRESIIKTDISVINSSTTYQPTYSGKYNIFIGGTKIARGVTIKNLIVTYYGRQPKVTNMDTMLQHARMYGYRKNHMDVTRLFITEEIEKRFTVIYESEKALRDLIKRYPNENYRSIIINNTVRATRNNVLNKFSIGYYVSGKNYLQRYPYYNKSDIDKTTKNIDAILEDYPTTGIKTEEKEVDIEILIDILNNIHSVPRTFSLWNDKKIISALELMKTGNITRGLLIVSRNRNIGSKDKFGALLPPGYKAKASREYPTLFIFKVTGENWNGKPFWIPAITFPDTKDKYTFVFNLS